MHIQDALRMCCSFYLYLPIMQSYPTGYSSIVTTSVGYMVPSERKSDPTHETVTVFLYNSMKTATHSLFFGKVTH